MTIFPKLEGHDLFGPTGYAYGQYTGSLLFMMTWKISYKQMLNHRCLRYRANARTQFSFTFQQIRANIQKYKIALTQIYFLGKQQKQET